MAEVYKEVLANVWTRAVTDSNSNSDSTALRRTVSKRKVSVLLTLSTSMMPAGQITQKTVIVIMLYMSRSAESGLLLEPSFKNKLWLTQFIPSFQSPKKTA